MRESTVKVLTGCLPLRRRKQRTRSLLSTIPAEICAINRIWQMIAFDNLIRPHVDTHIWPHLY